MRIGYAVPVSGPWATPENIGRVATRAEELGYSDLWTFQRLLAPVGREMGTTYRSVADPVVTLAYLAGVTRRIGLGVAVLNMPFHSPALLAKQLGTLQTVSGGRLTAGLGLGWMPEEFAASGVPFERRGARAEEYLDVLRKLWNDEVVEHEGEFYRIPAARQEPRPVPGPPRILLGGGADAALRRAGRLADGWVSASREDLRTIGEKIYIVKEAAREAGRDPESLRFVCRGVTTPRPSGRPGRAPLTGSYDEIRRDVADLAASGVTDVFHDLNFVSEVVAPDADPAEAMRLAEEMLVELAPDPRT
ncbi:TIGR03619 family F420-dependent LLM class oxidoreductase [Spongiactinospora sp. TRM90649]|uniref:TIGR03619 family F420-dependent LLM class oxidoreductase n=1 Tax=Spongiactinospora sp. TRM90649 TaxID=3031114 RepID=UPI0023F98ED5|nr:TIGR03619 family F420-dependent LLM class oxidoreductase [Spongiactinospora sp. TRM90649]MDF5758215.1 TIGR03619 family F420-dependent LLM class oxidoreductase [Spongiactinospora sp. TRM90649]